jgi:hypothetical protein
VVQLDPPTPPDMIIFFSSGSHDSSLEMIRVPCPIVAIGACIVETAPLRLIQVSVPGTGWNSQ